MTENGFNDAQQMCRIDGVDAKDDAPHRVHVSSLEIGTGS